MKQIIRFGLTCILVLALAGCSAAMPAASASPTPSQARASSATAGAAPLATRAAQAATSAASLQSHEASGDYRYDPASAVAIRLKGSSIEAGGAGVSVTGSTATIQAPGTYVLSGSLTDGQIVVKSGLKGVVRLVLDGVEIHSASSAPIFIQDAEKAVILLAEGKQNTLSDGASYTYADPASQEPNAALFSKSDLSIAGNGSLTVLASFQDGISSKDGLVIAGGTLQVSAADDGIRGKDYLVIEGGSLTVEAKGDGLKSDNQEDATKGYIAIAAGSLQVRAGGDAIDAQSSLSIQGGSFQITSGGGSGQQAGPDVSAKGLKGAGSVTIAGGSFAVDATDDAIHSNGSIAITGGTFTLASGDDAVHADESLTIEDGELRVTRSYEGLESAAITLNGGTIHIQSSDDGINGAGGRDASGANPGGGPGRRPGGGGQDAFISNSKIYLHIHGGYIYVDANGDGIDINGAVEMTGGTLIVNGPTEQMNGAIDYDAGFKMTGGYLLAAGSAGMAMTTDQTSSQPAVLIYLTATQPAGTPIHIQDQAGQEVLTFVPSKAYQSLAFSSALLAQGASYSVFTGGSAGGALEDGLAQGGSYTPGTQAATFSLSSRITQVGSGGRMGPGGGRRPPQP